MRHPIWHWPGVTPAALRRILADPGHPDFARAAGHLLSAVTDPEEIRRWIALPLLAEHYERRIRRRVPKGFARSAADLLVRAIRRNLGAAASPAARKPDPDPDMVSLGRRLRAFREEMGLAAGALARRRGVSRQWIAAMEGGRASPTVRSLLAYVEAAGGAVSIEFRRRREPEGVRSHPRVPRAPAPKAPGRGPAPPRGS